MAIANSRFVRHGWRLSSSTCIEPQNDSMGALSKQSPTVPIELTRPRRRTFWVKAHEVYWLPWSEWMTVLAEIFLVAPALARASLTRAASQRRSMAQPTTFLEYRSSTAQP